MLLMMPLQTMKPLLGLVACCLVISYLAVAGSCIKLGPAKDTAGGNIIDSLPPCTLSLAGSYTINISLSVVSDGNHLARSEDSIWSVTYKQLSCSKNSGATYQMVVQPNNVSSCGPTSAIFSVGPDGTLDLASIQLTSRHQDCQDPAAVPSPEVLQMLAVQAQARYVSQQATQRYCR
jgi:hypothetical protein